MEENPHISSPSSPPGRKNATSSPHGGGSRPFSPLVRIGCILLLVGLIGFAIYQCYRHIVFGLNTVRTQEVTDTSYASLQLYVFRDEQVMPSAPGQVYLYQVQNGEKVAVDTVLGTAYAFPDETQREDLQVQLDVYADRLSRLKNGQSTLTMSYPAAAQERMEASYRAILSAASAGNLRAMNGLSEEWLVAMDRYDMLVENRGHMDTKFQALTEARDALVRNLQAAGTLSTPLAGWFYYHTDGYESIFPYQEVMTMTPAAFRDMTVRAAESSAQTEGGGHGGKMVYNAEWYAVATASLADAACFVVGDSYTMLCGTGESISMTCARVDADAEGAMLVFRSLAMPDDFAFDRFFTAETVYHSVSGYRVPTSAMASAVSPTTGETVTGVYVLEGNYVVFRRVWVQDSRDGYLIAYTSARAQAILDAMDEKAQEAIRADGWKFLQLNDHIITQGNGLYDGKILG